MLALYAINHVSKAHARYLMKLLTLCKQFGTRSGLSGLSGLIGIETVSHSDSKHYIFLFENVDPEKNQPTTKKRVTE